MIAAFPAKMSSLCQLEMFQPKLAAYACNKVCNACRRATKAAQKLPDGWEQLVEDHHLRMAYKVMLEQIPPELVISMDETFVWYLPMGNATTYEETNSKAVCSC